MNRTPDYEWFNPMPAPRLAIVIPFPVERCRRPLEDQTVTRALNSAASSEAREQYTHRALLVLMALATVGTIALVSRVVS